jgi:hypothetical protein
MHDGEPVRLRGIPVMEARLRRHQPGGAEEGLCRSGVPQCLPP